MLNFYIVAEISLLVKCIVYDGKKKHVIFKVTLNELIKFISRGGLSILASLGKLLVRFLPFLELNVYVGSGRSTPIKTKNAAQ